MKLDTGEAGAAQRLAAAERAAGEVRDGMVLGFGTGRAANLVLEAIARRAQAEGLKIVGVPSSERTAQAARSLGLGLVSLDDNPTLDLMIDGADEVDPRRRLVKGAGGALMREKVLAAAARRLVIVVESAKLVPVLGTTRGVPLEILPFARAACEHRLRDLGGTPSLRRTPDGQPVLTDNGNWLFDCTFPPAQLDDAERLDAQLHAIPGLLETGLFVAPLDPTVYAGAPDGVQVLGPR